MRAALFFGGTAILTVALSKSMMYVCMHRNLGWVMRCQQCWKGPELPCQLHVWRACPARALALTAHGSCCSAAEYPRSAHAQSAVHPHACAAQACCDACGVLVPRGERVRVRPQLMPACPPTRQAFIMPALESSLI